MAQFDPGATMAPQFWRNWNCPGAMPPRAIPVRYRLVAPLFVSVTACPVLFDPRLTVPKVSAEVESATVGFSPPVPVTESDCGEPEALSVRPSSAVTLPLAIGAKSTMTRQLAPTARDPTQSFDWAKSVAPVPVKAIEETISGAVPLLETVTACAGLLLPLAVAGNVKVVSNMLTEGVGAMPVPLRDTLCEAVAALSERVSEALSAPTATGANVTEIVQLDSIARLAGQVVLSVKEAAPVPEMAMEESVKAFVPVFLRVRDCTAAANPSIVPAKESAEADRLTTGTGVSPVPLRASAWGEAGALSATSMAAVSVPAATGLNPTLIVQDEPTARVAAQVVLEVNELALAPTMAMLEMASAAVPEFFRVTV